MANEFSAEQIAEFKDAFELFDRTGEGIIPYSECAALARCFGYNPLDSHVRVLLGGGDEENPATTTDMMTKSISFEDFLPILWAISQADEPGAYEDFLEGLKVFDKEGNGTMSSAELRHVMCGLGEKMTNAEMDQLLDGLEDINGQVNYAQFIKKLMSDEGDPVQ